MDNSSDLNLLLYYYCYLDFIAYFNYFNFRLYSISKVNYFRKIISYCFVSYFVKKILIFK